MCNCIRCRIPDPWLLRYRSESTVFRLLLKLQRLHRLCWYVKAGVILSELLGLIILQHLVTKLACLAEVRLVLGYDFLLAHYLAVQRPHLTSLLELHSGAVGAMDSPVFEPHNVAVQFELPVFGHGAPPTARLSAASVGYIFD